MDPVQPTRTALARYFVRLGALGFGGPAALTERMRRDLVEERRWVSPAEFDLGLTIAAACPGPLAYQLAVFCGYVRHQARGAVLVGIAFATAPFLIVIGIASGYEHWSTSTTLRALFYGASPVVVALIARACWNLGRKVLHHAPLAWGAAVTGAGLTWLTASEPLWVIALAGALGAWRLRPSASPPAVGPAKAPADTSSTGGAAAALFALGPAGATGPLTQLFGFFFQTGCLVFGSGLVIVPFLRHAVVDTFGWMSVQQFLDAVTVGLVSPGPVVITATFVGYAVGGTAGAAVATTGMFLPAILFTLAAAPWFARHRDSAALTGFVRGVTAAVVGVLAGTVPLIASEAVPDAPAVLILGAACLTMLWRRVPDAVIVAGGALAGVLIGSV